MTDRRQSVDNWANQLFNVISQTKVDLNNIWDEMSLSEDQRQSRLLDSQTFVKNLLEEMIDHERKQLTKIHATHEKYLEKVRALCKELDFDENLDRKLPKGLVPQTNYLKLEIKSLEAVKADKLVEQKNIYDAAREACDKIGAVIPNGELFETRIMSADEVVKLQMKTMEAQTVFKERLYKIKEIQQDLHKMVSRIGRLEFSSADLALLDIDYDKVAAVLDEHIVENFVQLHSKAKVIFDEWFDKMKHEYHDLMVELTEYWDKCHVPESERYFPLHFDPERQTHHDIQLLKKEVSKLKLRYVEGKAIYDKLNEWLIVWEEFIEIDSGTIGAEKYKNRGGQLQAYLKREKQIKASIPKLLAELEQMCDEFAKTNENIPTAGANNMNVAEYARFLKEEYEERKMHEKLNKDLEKKNKLVHETRFGVTPSPKSALNRVRQTPASIHKSPRPKKVVLDASQLSSFSAIEPVHTPSDGPKTSSPKDINSPKAPYFFAKSRSPLSPLPNRHIIGSIGRPSVLPPRRYLTTPSKVAVVTPTSRPTPQPNCVTPSKPWRY
uniref:Protein regulator of cytokinesis 1 n=1 Tax=Panagrolaimus sp. JU765 TaxID=591449 RepID=A0AC34QI97_9BILA